VVVGGITKVGMGNGVTRVVGGAVAVTVTMVLKVAGTQTPSHKRAGPSQMPKGLHSSPSSQGNLGPQGSPVRTLSFFGVAGTSLKVGIRSMHVPWVFSGGKIQQSSAGPHSGRPGPQTFEARPWGCPASTGVAATREEAPRTEARMRLRRSMVASECCITV